MNYVTVFLWGLCLIDDFTERKVWMQSFMRSYSCLGNFVAHLTSEYYQVGMKHKHKVRQCSEPYPNQTQYQEEKIIYIAAEEVVWDCF